MPPDDESSDLTPEQWDALMKRAQRSKRGKHQPNIQSTPKSFGHWLNNYGGFPPFLGKEQHPFQTVGDPTPNHPMCSNKLPPEFPMEMPDDLFKVLLTQPSLGTSKWLRVDLLKTVAGMMKMNEYHIRCPSPICQAPENQPGFPFIPGTKYFNTNPMIQMLPLLHGKYLVGYCKKCDYHLWAQTI